MGNLVTKLNSILASKVAISGALEAKGVEVNNAPLSSYANLINNIESISNNGSGTIYGVIYDPTNVNGSPTCQRVIKNGDTLKEVDKFQYMPAHNFKRCVMDNLENRHINYYLADWDSNYKVDGTPSVLTGEDGDVMVEIPITYWKIDTERQDRKNTLSHFRSTI